VLLGKRSIKEWVRRYRGKGGKVGREVVERIDKEIQQQERFERIQKSRWNRYKEIGTMETPRYLRERRKEERMIRVARFRLGNELREGKYWEEEKRRCRICGWEEKMWEHVVDVYMRKGEGRAREKILWN